MKTRAEIIAEARRICAEIDQYFLDIEHWNDTHPDLPIEPDPDGKMQKIRAACGKMLMRERVA